MLESLYDHAIESLNSNIATKKLTIIAYHIILVEKKSKRESSFEFKNHILSRFQARGLFVRPVSTRTSLDC